MLWMQVGRGTSKWTPWEQTGAASPQEMCLGEGGMDAKSLQGDVQKRFLFWFSCNDSHFFWGTQSVFTFAFLFCSNIFVELFAYLSNFAIKSSPLALNTLGSTSESLDNNSCIKPLAVWQRDRHHWDSWSNCETVGGETRLQVLAWRLLDQAPAGSHFQGQGFNNGVYCCWV